MFHKRHLLVNFLNPLSLLIFIYFYTGRFIMYSEITKLFYRKTVGYVFTKPIQLEGTTKKFIETGRLCKQISSVRPLTSEDDVERVRASFLHGAKKSKPKLQLRSNRCRKQRCGVFYVSVWCDQFH